MPNYWLTSDYHYNHANIIKYCNRPFKSLEDMNETLIRNHNSRVKPEDTVLHLGDFCFRNSNNIGNGLKEKAVDIERKFNGKIVHVRGNHDCFLKSTRILTKNGYKTHNEIRCGDIIPTFNIKTQTIEFKPIKKIFKYKVLNSYNIKSKSINAGFTENHEHIIRSYKKPYYLIKKTSKELFNKKREFSLLFACASKNPDYKIKNNNIKLLAWLYTDSYFTKNRIEIYQSKPNNIIRIKKLLKNCGIKYIFKTRYRKIKFICGKKIKKCLPAGIFILKDSEKILQKLNVKNKITFPDYFWNFSDKQMNTFINEATIADGSVVSSGSIQLWGKKEKLDMFMGLCVTHGIGSNRIKDKRGCYYLCIHKNRTKELKFKEANKTYRKIVNYNNLMWCIEVDNNNIFIENDGKPLITGNSRNSINTPIKYIILERSGYKVFCCHKPEDVPVNEYEMAFVAHVHDRWYIKRVGNCIMLNVGVDVNKFMPISFDEAIYKILKFKKEEVNDESGS